MKIVRGPNSAALAHHLCSFSVFLYFMLITFSTRTLWYALIRQGLYYAPFYGNKVRTLLQYNLAPRISALYALAPNHVFGQ